MKRVIGIVVCLSILAGCAGHRRHRPPFPTFGNQWSGSRQDKEAPVSLASGRLLKRFGWRLSEDALAMGGSQR